ncbi:MAG: hypothetical protein H0T76_10150 [Nannocystis sp.]|nr:hypothetical protein [Nannocystis sp.]MBA3546833.1 hypothetical protein [Nannocystis sp.]
MARGKWRLLPGLATGSALALLRPDRRARVLLRGGAIPPAPPSEPLVQPV